jgi:predicted DNA-binding transcriptional regulator AlpA
MEDYVKADVVSEKLGISEGALAQMRHRGTGPKFVKLGARSVRYRLSDVNAWLERNTFQQTGAARTA